MNLDLKNTLLSLTAICIFLFVNVEHPLLAQVATLDWTKSLGGSSEDILRDIIPIGKDKYLTTIHTESTDGLFASDYGHVRSSWMILDKEGNVQSLTPYWHEKASLEAMIPHCNGYIGSSIETNWRDSSQYYIFKTDEDLNLIWEFYIFSNARTWYTEKLVNSDETISLIVNTESNTGFFENQLNQEWTMWHLLLSPDGMLLSKDLLDIPKNAFGNSLIHVGNAHYIYGLEYGSSGTIQDDDIFLCKFDENWTREWYREYGGSRHEYSFDFHLTDDGHFISISNTESQDGDISMPTGYIVAWLAKIDLDGNLVLDKTIAFDGFGSRPGKIRPFCNGNYLIDYEGAAYEPSNAEGRVFLTIDQNFNILNQVILDIGDENISSISSLFIDQDGSALISFVQDTYRLRRDIVIARTHVEAWASDRFAVIARPSTNTQCAKTLEVNTICDIPGVNTVYTWKREEEIIGQTFEPTFTVDQSGTYLVEIEAQNACGMGLYIECHEIEISVAKAPQFESINIYPNTCGQNNGRIKLSIQSDVVDYEILVDGESDDLEIFPMMSDTYEIIVLLDSFCRTDTTLFAPKKSCPIFVPNSFSPNNDGINDLLQIFSGSDEVFDVLTYEIYDRWGKIIYSTPKFKSNKMQYWWDGTDDTKSVKSGVYLLRYVVRMDDGTLDMKNTSVTVAK